MKDVKNILENEMSAVDEENKNSIYAVSENDVNNNIIEIENNNIVPQKVIGLTEREYMMLEIIDRQRIVRAVELTWQAGYTDYTYCRKCLGKLEKYGYVTSARDMYGHKCYYLTGRGLSEIGKPWAHTYEMTYTTNHELTVARVATYLCITQGASIFDMFFDPQLKPRFARGEHRPDILLNDVAYEIELNHKRQEKLEQNVRSNERFAEQIWIVPRNKQKVARNLEKAAKAVAAEITILWLDDLEKVIANANVHNNRIVQRTGEEQVPEEDPAIKSVMDKYKISAKSGR